MTIIKYIARRFEEALNTVADPSSRVDEVNTSCTNIFAAMMAEKLHASTRKGRAGWHDREAVSDEELSQMLIEHLSKSNAGTFVDIANFAMMLHLRDADPKLLGVALKGGAK